ncbi:MAG: PAS domain S-box protein [Proteobacteria bacterium]|nr:PAS domain S-box protein [Pseudomonadota bacterium]MBU1582222.1 PAS domain S-box protein [Pseudomonadota bacterium]MBU2452854.1 PAS domain S-box protein [Pseudomonadota bacterium]MBU2631901.1 PAS domain S-box protein [Pseudomonadota bacterium]
MVTLTDSSDRKAVEEAILKSEKTLESIFKAAPTGIGMVCDRVIIRANDKLCNMIGYSEAELVGQSSRMLYPTDEDFEFVGREKYKQVKEKGTGTVETRWQHKNGSIIDIILSSTPINQEDWSEGVTFTALDITERKQMELALKKSEERYRKYFEEILSGAFITAPTGELLECNQEFVRIFGFSSKQEAIGKPVTLLYKNVSKRDEFIGRIMKNKGVKHFESQMVKKDGSIIYIIENAVGVFDQDGNLKKIRGYLVDVTDSKNMEAQLRQAQKMEAIGTLVGGISHDFNNLLQAINGYAELISMNKKKEDPDYLNLQALHHAAKRAGDLVRQLLVFSREAPTKKQHLEINKEVAQAKNLLEKTIPKMITIKMKLFDKIWPVHADPLQIEQVILNLGSNAADAMPDGGQITIETNNLKVKPGGGNGTIGIPPGNYVLLSIRDTGHGMDKATMEKIFDPFFTTKKIGKGTGLGLSSVYGIVTHHKGKIICHSREGEGTVFKLYLPAFEQHFIKKEETALPEMKKGNETILLVDDEAAILDFASKAFGLLGYTCIEAVDGEDALEKYSKNPLKIDLILLDLSMPGMGGYKCLEKLMAAHPQPKVVIASGYSADTTIKDCLALGAADYIRKPYQLAELSNLIRKLLDQPDN